MADPGEIASHRLGPKAIARCGIDGFTIEKDKTAFARLQRHISERTPSGIDAKAMEGDFVALREQILSWCGNKAFVFFFVDPTGWKDVGVGVLQRSYRDRDQNF